jgi:hypothetical protein
VRSRNARSASAAWITQSAIACLVPPISTAVIRRIRATTKRVRKPSVASRTRGAAALLARQVTINQDFWRRARRMRRKRAPAHSVACSTTRVKTDSQPPAVLRAHPSALSTSRATWSRVRLTSAALQTSHVSNVMPVARCCRVRIFAAYSRLSCATRIPTGTANVCTSSPEKVHHQGASQLCATDTCTTGECCTPNPSCSADVCTGRSSLITGSFFPHQCEDSACTAGDCCVDNPTCDSTLVGATHNVNSCVLAFASMLSLSFSFRSLTIGRVTLPMQVSRYNPRSLILFCQSLRLLVFRSTNYLPLLPNIYSRLPLFLALPHLTARLPDGSHAQRVFNAMCERAHVHRQRVLRTIGHVSSASDFLTFICVLCTQHTQISRSICNLVHYRCTASDCDGDYYTLDPAAGLCATATCAENDSECCVRHPTCDVKDLCFDASVVDANGVAVSFIPKPRAEPCASFACTLSECCTCNPTNGNGGDCSSTYCEASICSTAARVHLVSAAQVCVGSSCECSGDVCLCSLYSAHANLTINSQLRDTLTTGAACTQSECCVSNPTCSSATCAAAGVHRNSFAGFCAGSVCTQSECCEANDTCVTSDCGLGFTRNSKTTPCTAEMCTYAECCFANASCPGSGIICPQGE